MLKNKLFLTIIAMLIVITLILVAFFALWTLIEKKNQPSDPHEAAKSAVGNVQAKKQTAIQEKENTVVIKDILTNLSEKDRVVKASFAFQLDDKKGKEEFENLDFKVKGIINQTLGDMKVEQISGSKGQEYLISVLMNKLNGILSEGKLKQVWITDYIIQ